MFMFTSTASKILPFSMINFFFQGIPLENPKYTLDAEICREGLPIKQVSCQAVLIKRQRIACNLLFSGMQRISASSSPPSQKPQNSVPLHACRFLRGRSLHDKFWQEYSQIRENQNFSHLHPPMGVIGVLESGENFLIRAIWMGSSWCQGLLTYCCQRKQLGNFRQTASLVTVRVVRVVNIFVEILSSFLSYSWYIIFSTLSQIQTEFGNRLTQMTCSLDL